MALIPAGTFQMGAVDGAEDQHPVLKVTLDAFSIDRTEVTVAHYELCVLAGACAAADSTISDPDASAWDRANYPAFCTGNSIERRNHPVNCVDWSQAEAYCKWAGKRLPTEAEWEYAARGTDNRRFPWGNSPPGPKLLNAADDKLVALYNDLHMGTGMMFSGDDGWATTAPVGSYPEGRSAFGLDDMAGNVWEWVADWYDARAYGSRKAGTTNPTGPASGEKRVMRGGGWFGSPIATARSSNRGKADPSARGPNRGFRCAK